MSAKWMMALVVILLLNACAAGPTMPSSEERQAVAPTGKLRLGLLVGGATTKDPVTGELRGPAIDIGRELARRVEVSFGPIAYGAVAELINDAPKDKWGRDRYRNQS